MVSPDAFFVTCSDLILPIALRYYQEVQDTPARPPTKSALNAKVVLNSRSLEEILVMAQDKRVSSLFDESFFAAFLIQLRFVCYSAQTSEETVSQRVDDDMVPSRSLIWLLRSLSSQRSFSSWMEEYYSTSLFSLLPRYSRRTSKALPLALQQRDSLVFSETRHRRLSRHRSHGAAQDSSRPQDNFGRSSVEQLGSRRKRRRHSHACSDAVGDGERKVALVETRSELSLDLLVLLIF